jgi:1-acyl-sn-glycerol-3-phosphate acyltransferase
MIDRVFEGMGPRAALQSIDSAVAGLGEQYSLIIFPEGTRGDGEEVGIFRSGVYQIAKRIPGIELIPVYMENLNRILPKGKVLPLPLLSNVTFGAPIQMQAGENKAEFLVRLRNALLELKEI